MTADTRFELHVSIARKIRAFVFGFSYYGVLKIRFVPSRILRMFCISFRTSRKFIAKKQMPQRGSVAEIECGRRPETVRSWAVT